MDVSSAEKLARIFVLLALIAAMLFAGVLFVRTRRMESHQIVLKSTPAAKPVATASSSGFVPAKEPAHAVPSGGRQDDIGTFQGVFPPSDAQH